MSTNYVNRITGTNGTTYDIAEGVDTRVFTGTCSTAADTAAKVVTLDDATNFSLTEGVKVAVTFTYACNGTIASLNVNSTGAKTITFMGLTLQTRWTSGETVIFTYNGSYWVMSSSSGALQWAIDSATDSKVTQNYSTSSSNFPVLFSQTAGTSSTASRGDVGAYLNNSIYATPSTGTLTVNYLNIGTQINDLFKVTTAAFTASGSVSAHSYISAENKTIPTASRVSGYNLVGIVGVGTSNYRIYPSSCYVVNNTTVYLGFANGTASSASAPTLTLYLLWMKASAA